MQYKNHDIPDCPKCGDSLVGEAEDFPVVGRTGENSRVDFDCMECYALLTAVRIDADTVDISPRATPEH